MVIWILHLYFNVLSFPLLHANRDTVLVDSSDLVKSQIKQGEWLFHALPDSVDQPVRCAQCHTVAVTDTFNWNPSLQQLGKTVTSMSYDEFREILADPYGSDLLMETHPSYIITMPLPQEEEFPFTADYHRYIFSEDQLTALYQFIRAAATTPVRQNKPFNFRLLVFCIVCFLVLAAGSDLIITRFILRRRYHWAVILSGSILIVLIIRREVNDLGLQEGYSPDQPVKFSHQVHSIENKINCLYCHPGANRSNTAGFPSVSTCMNCHQVVREGSRSGETEIRNILDAYEQNTRIAWIRVYNLPDHVFFSHQQHVKAGSMNCLECHPGMDETDRTVQSIGLSMQWCLDCHQTSFVQVADDPYYQKKLLAGSPAILADSMSVRELGGWDCMKCHH